MPNEEKQQGANSGSQLRLLIQQVQTNSGKSWRLIAYGDGDRHSAPEFKTLEAVLALLRRDLPELDLSNTAVPADGPGSSIIFAADVRLTEAQRTALGLISVSGGKSGPLRS